MPKIVRVRHNGAEFNVGAAHAKAMKYKVLDESPYDRGGHLRPTTRENGRPRLPRTTVEEAAAKKAAKTSTKPAVESDADKAN